MVRVWVWVWWGWGRWVVSWVRRFVGVVVDFAAASVRVWMGDGLWREGLSGCGTRSVRVEWARMVVSERREGMRRGAGREVRYRYYPDCFYLGDLRGMWDAGA